MIKHRALLVQEALNFDELPDRIKRKILKYNSIFDSNSIMYKQKGEFTKKATEELSDLDEDLCELISDFVYDKQEAIEKAKIPPVVEPIVPATIIPQPKREKSFLGLF